LRLEFAREGLKRAAGAVRLTGGRRGGARKKPLPVSLHARGLVLWAAALVTAIVCIWEHVHSAELASRIEDLRGEREELLAEIGFLRMECTELSSRERVEELAGEMLGMRYPKQGEVVWLTPDGRRLWTKSDYVEAGADDRSDG
jgi:cell division protein FtsL